MTPDLIHLSYYDLLWVSLGLLALGIFLWVKNLGDGQILLLNASRMVVQLLLMGLWLGWVFAADSWPLVFLVVVLMLVFALLEIQKHLKFRLARWGHSLIAMGALASTALTSTFLVVVLLIEPDPWWDPQYVLTILGMILGNAMTTLGLSLNQFMEKIQQRQNAIEAQLALGYSLEEVVGPLRRAALHAASLPVINMLAAAGLVSLPGMMTGQIIAGISPVEAVKYQILIMFVIAFANISAALIAVHFLQKKIFDERQRLLAQRIITRPGDAL